MIVKVNNTADLEGYQTTCDNQMNILMPKDEVLRLLRENPSVEIFNENDERIDEDMLTAHVTFNGQRFADVAEVISYVQDNFTYNEAVKFFRDNTNTIDIYNHEGLVDMVHLDINEDTEKVFCVEDNL